MNSTTVPEDTTPRSAMTFTLSGALPSAEDQARAIAMLTTRNADLEAALAQALAERDEARGERDRALLDATLARAVIAGHERINRGLLAELGMPGCPHDEGLELLAPAPKPDISTAWWNWRGGRKAGR